MKTLLIILLALVAPATIAGLFIQTDSEVLWRIVERWAVVVGAVTFICGVVFAAWRGNSYKELERLAATRKEEINDLRLEIVELNDKLRSFQNFKEYERAIELRQQADREQIHRSKAK